MRHHFTKSLLFLLSCLLSGQSVATSSEYELLQQLRADYVVLLQARADYEQLYTQGKTGSNARDDFAAWVSQLSEQVTEGCRKVLSITSKPLPADLPCGDILAGQTAPAAINIATESTEAENTARMIDQLNGSLGEFDERLLREQDRVKAKKPRTEVDSAASGGGGSAGSGDAAGDGDGEQETQSETDGDKSASESDQAGSVEQGQPGSSSQKGVQGKSFPATKSSAPADIPDGSNDDIIARQLREAAEKETDPELKKKLWDEYRRYKSGEL